LLLGDGTFEVDGNVGVSVVLFGGRGHTMLWRSGRFLASTTEQMRIVDVPMVARG
jgi:hypothetical protein